MRLVRRRLVLLIEAGLVLALILLLLVALRGRAPGDAYGISPGAWQSETAGFDGAGGIHLSMEIFLPKPARGAVPVVAYAHSGGWVEGDALHDLLLSDTVNGLTAQGIALASIDYRLGVPAESEIADVRSAIHALRTQGNALGIDPRRIALDGSSAGAHLMMMAAALDGTSEDGPADPGAAPLRAVVDLFGPADLNRPDWGPDMTATITRVFGARPGSGSPELVRESPVSRVHAGMAPVLVIHGTADSLVPFEQGVEMYQRLRQAGVSASFVAVANADHGLVPIPGATPSPDPATVVDGMIGFLTDHLR